MSRGLEVLSVNCVLLTIAADAYFRDGPETELVSGAYFQLGIQKGAKNPYTLRENTAPRDNGKADKRKTA
jgi:hypothetical protein